VYSKRHSRRGLYSNLRQVININGLRACQSVLNIGAGGEIDRVLRAEGIDFISLDIDAARKPDVVASMGQMSVFGDGQFDAIFCMEVLEHVTNPFQAVAEARRVLRPGGVFVGSTPFILGTHDAPYDFFRYTKHGIELLFREFEKDLLIERNSYFDAVAVLPLRLFATATKRERERLAIKFPLYVVTTWWLTLLGRGIQNSSCTTGYFFVFRRPLEAKYG